VRKGLRRNGIAISCADHFGVTMPTSPHFAEHRIGQTAWCPATALQALELLRALDRQLRKMTGQLACLEREDVTRTNGRAREMRLEAAALRRDIREGQVLIDRLQRRYLGGGEHTQQRLAGRQSRAMVGLQA
jgi:hypothetical protein